MVDFRDNSNARQEVEARLETPRCAGFLYGMSATRMIGTRLARVYEVAVDVPDDMGAILGNLEGKSGKGC